MHNSELLETITTNTDLITTYAYEPKRNLKTQVDNTFSAASVISQYNYKYDSIGRRTSVENTGSAFAQTAFNKYDYNDRSELTGSKRYLGNYVENPVPSINPEVTPENRAYTYDPIGNRTETTENTTTTDYVTNNLNQYTGITGGIINTPGYDDDGNMTTYADKKYTWNAENRLIFVEPETPSFGDKRIGYIYDYMGRRVNKKVSVYENSTWTLAFEKYFVYNGWNLVEEITTAEGSTSEQYYVWGLDLSQSIQGAGGIGGLIATVDSSSLTYYYLYDANGNVGQLVDTSGVVQAHYEYDPFGNTVKSDGDYADDNPFRFSTKYFEGETGLYYYGYRFYCLELGRWVSRDPIGERGGINLTLFAANNPSNKIDSYGLYYDVLIDPHGVVESVYNDPYTHIYNPYYPAHGPTPRQPESYNYSEQIAQNVQGILDSLGEAASNALEKSDTFLKNQPARGVALEAMVGNGPLTLMLGINIMFFPESCEIASYRYFSGALAAILKQLREYDIPDWQEDPFRFLSVGNTVIAGSGTIVSGIPIPVGKEEHNAASWLGWFWNIEFGVGMIAASAFGGAPVNNPMGLEPNNNQNLWIGGALGVGKSLNIPNDPSVGGTALYTYYEYLYGKEDPEKSVMKFDGCTCTALQALNVADPTAMTKLMVATVGFQAGMNLAEYLSK